MLRPWIAVEHLLVRCFERSSRLAVLVRALPLPCHLQLLYSVRGLSTGPGRVRPAQVEVLVGPQDRPVTRRMRLLFKFGNSFVAVGAPVWSNIARDLHAVDIEMDAPTRDWN